MLIGVSIDGVREVHDRHRRLADGGPTFDLVLPRFRLLLAARPYCNVLMADRIGKTLYAERNAMLRQKHHNPAYPVLSYLEDRQAATSRNNRSCGRSRS